MLRHNIFYGRLLSPYSVLLLPRRVPISWNYSYSTEDFLDFSTLSLKYSYFDMYILFLLAGHDEIASCASATPNQVLKNKLCLSADLKDKVY